MNQYFDYNSWADQRSREINRENAKPQKKKKLTKREVATFKKQKKEKDRIKKGNLVCYSFLILISLVV